MLSTKIYTIFISMIKLLNILMEEIKFQIKKPILTLYHGTSNKYPIITLSNIKIDRDESMGSTTSGFQKGRGSEQCIGFYLSKSSGIDKFPEMERNSAMAFTYNAMEKHKEKVGAKAEMLIYEVKLKPDVILRDQQNSCVGKHHIEEYGEVDGIQEKNGMETVIFNKDKIQSIRLIKKGIQNPNQTSWENEIILK